jgi:hypothetical protein
MLRAMRYLDPERLEAIDTASFQNAEPFPWINPAELITPEGYEELRRTLPPVELFDRNFGVARAHGQRPHDRYSLEYDDRLPIAGPWKQFVAELQGPEYRRFIERLFGIRWFFFNFHWHYTPQGCEVSPHCDAKRKIGSHIFYLNTEEDWDPSWGGDTLVLDDNGRFAADSAPEFKDFDRQFSSHAIGNYSLLFRRRGNSWHGVREVTSPEGYLRKVFIVVVNAYNAKSLVHRLFGRRKAPKRAREPAMARATGEAG